MVAQARKDAAHPGTAHSHSLAPHGEHGGNSGNPGAKTPNKTRWTIIRRCDLEVGERIAAGSFGNVWEATVMISGVDGVVKVPFPDPDLDGEEACRKFPPPSHTIRESFAREIEILGAIDHPNVVTMLGATDDMACIVLELAKTDLFMLVKRLNLRTPIATFRDWSRQILEAVAFLHENSVLHRDIKSANVLVFPDNSVKLCDFGLAIFEIAPVMEVRREMTTVWYRAPELLMGDAHYTPLIDEWSVGCVLLEILGGGCIFPGKIAARCMCGTLEHVNYNSDQLGIIFRLVGTPTDRAYLSRMHCIGHFRSWPIYPSRLRQKIVAAVTTPERFHASGDTTSCRMAGVGIHPRVKSPRPSYTGVHPQAAASVNSVDSVDSVEREGSGSPERPSRADGVMGPPTLGGELRTTPARHAFIEDDLDARSGCVSTHLQSGLPVENSHASALAACKEREQTEELARQITDVFDMLLCYDPAGRRSCREVLHAPFFAPAQTDKSRRRPPNISLAGSASAPTSGTSSPLSALENRTGMPARKGGRSSVLKNALRPLPLQTPPQTPSPNAARLRSALRPLPRPTSLPPPCPTALLPSNLRTVSLQTLRLPRTTADEELEVDSVSG